VALPVVPALLRPTRPPALLRRATRACGTRCRLDTNARLDVLSSDRYVQVVNVYQAMGGGWVDAASSIAPKPQHSVAPRS
jgi:hypothetical protein